MKVSPIRRRTAALLLPLIALLSMGEVLFGFTFLGTASGDSVNTFLPFRFLGAQQIAAGQFPLWNSLIFCGNPLFANQIANPLSPLTLPFFFFSPVTAYLIGVYATILFGLFTGYHYLRKVPRVPRTVAVVGSALLFFTGSQIEDVSLPIYSLGMSTLPILLILCHRLLRRGPTLGNFTYLVLTFTLLNYLSTPPFVQYTLLAAIIYGLCLGFVHLREKGWRKALVEPTLLFGGAGLVAIPLCALILLPFVDFLQHSQRGSGLYPFELISLGNLLYSFIHPSLGIKVKSPLWSWVALPYNYKLYFAIPALPFVWLGMREDSKAMFRIPLWVVTLVGLFFVLLAATPLKPLLVESILPVLADHQLIRFIYFFHFGIGVFATLGLARFLDDPAEFLKPIGFRTACFGLIGVQAVVGVMFLGTLLFLLFGAEKAMFWSLPFKREDWTTPVQMASVLAPLVRIGALWAILRATRPFARKALLLLLIASALVTWRVVLPPAYRTSSIYPELTEWSVIRQRQGAQRSISVPLRTFGSGTQFDWLSGNPSQNIMYGVRSVGGYDSLLSGRYIDIQRLVVTDDEFFKRTWYVNRSWLAPRAEDLEHKLYALRAVKLVALPRDSEAPASLRHVRDGTVYDVYENPHALPRVFLVPELAILPSGDAVLARMEDPSWDPSRTVLVSRTDLNGLSLPDLPAEKGSCGTAKIASDTGSEVLVRVEAERTCVLFMSDCLLPGWSARADGIDGDLFYANHAFRGIVVPPGRHEVVYSYDPPSVRWGLRISLGSLGLLALILGGIFFLKRPSNDDPEEIAND